MQLQKAIDKKELDDSGKQNEKIVEYIQWIDGERMVVLLRLDLEKVGLTNCYYYS